MQQEEMSFKDRLIEIYSELDNLNLEELNKEIDQIKEQINELIAKCEITSKEREEIFLKEQEQGNKHIVIGETLKSSKQNIIQYARLEGKMKAWQILTIIGLLLLLTALIALIIVL